MVELASAFPTFEQWPAFVIVLVMIMQAPTWRLAQQLGKLVAQIDRSTKAMEADTHEIVRKLDEVHAAVVNVPTSAVEVFSAAFPTRNERERFYNDEPPMRVAQDAER